MNPSHILNLVLQRPTTPGQFGMWQNADVPRSGVHPHYLVIKPSGTEHLHQVSLTCGSVQMYMRADVHPPQLNLVLQSSTTPGQFDMWQNANVPRSGVPRAPGHQT